MKLQLVPNSQGLVWIKQGVKTFVTQPWIYLSLFFIFTAIISLLALIPVLGILIAIVFVPSVYLGFIVTTQTLEDGKPISPLLFFAAYRTKDERLGYIIKLGLTYFVLLLFVIASTTLIDGGSFAKMYVLGKQPSLMALGSKSFLFAAFLTMCLSYVLCMVMWLAAALIYLHKIPTFQAMFYGVMAIKHNIGAFIIFSFTWMLIGSVAMFVITLIAKYVGNSTFFAVLLPIFAVIMVSIFLTSIYYSYRACFQSRIEA